MDLAQNSKPFSGIGNGGHLQDLFHRGLGGRLRREVSHDNDRHGLLACVAGFVLEYRRDGNAMLAESSGNLPHDPRLVDGIETKIESALEFARTSELNAFIVLGPQFKRLESDRGSTDCGIDHVCDDGRCGWHCLLYTSDAADE